MNRDFCYCKGRNCRLRDLCKRYLEGTRINEDAGNYWWIDNCDEETRECYIRN